MSPEPPSRVVRLRSSDNQVFEVEEAAAALSEPIKNLVQVIGVNHVIPMPDVKSKTLAMVIGWCKKRAAQGTKTSADTGKRVGEWEAEFAEQLKQADVVIDLLCTASFLCVNDLKDHMFQRVADLINVKTVEEICKIFKPQE